MKTTIDPQGRIQLGEELRSWLGVQPGDEVVVEKRGSECVLTAAKPETGLRWEGNVLVHRGTSPAPAGDALAALRDERMDALGDGTSP